MRLRSPWQPRLADMKGSPAERLVAALADDVIEGSLSTGERLPAHRDLAYRLGIGLGTVTKACAVLERRGLVRSVHGRGTFVAALQARSGPAIDLSINTPPRMLSERLLARTLVAVSRRIDPDLLGLYPAGAGHDEHRRQMARWLAGLGLETEASRLLLCNGAQQALAVAFSVACRPGGTILTEALTYPGAITLSRHAGYRLSALDMDGEGLRPDALARALRSRAHGGGPAILYITPTMQNPTTATMAWAQRREIVRLCRRHDVMIVEDDVYSLCAAPGLPPLAMLAPERTFYANSLSKTLCPGLRIGTLVVPPALVERTEAALLATSLMVSPLSCAVMEQWLTDGTAESVRGSIRMEARRRQSLARALLGNVMRPVDHDGFHAWLPMAREQAERVSLAAAAAGVIVTPPRATAVDPEAPQSGIRLCLGAPSLQDLTAALTAVAGILRNLARGSVRRSASA